MKSAAQTSRIRTAVTWILLLSLLVGGCAFPGPETVPTDPTQIPTLPPTEPPTEPPTDPPTEPTEPPHLWQTGYISTMNPQAAYYDADGTPMGTLPRGAEVTYEILEDGEIQLLINGNFAYLTVGTKVVADYADVIPAHTLYVRTTVNLRDAEGRLLDPLAEKGASVDVLGFDYLYANGKVHMYRVSLDGEEGYIMPWYLDNSEEDAMAPYEDESYEKHAQREDLYGGGGAANLDYFPREKGPISGNPMPDECRTLYLVNWNLEALDEYLEIADNSGINAFVVDIVDGEAVGYAADVMTEYCPSGAEAACNTVEEYKAAIKKIKDAGYYVIGRITTFNDPYFVEDHPEYALVDTDGDPLRLSATYWPSAFSRATWQYKVDLAVEAVELMGFNEIQFDYVRFPDSTWYYEDLGIIDFRNTYGETKAQAVQRFLMYATDILHEHGAYVSADVYGESAYNYVTAYGQYWSAISNVVDVISGMPYPDHFSAWGDWLPWEHPYATLFDWGEYVMIRQSETATPAIVRTWIQAYNAIQEPYNYYGPDEVFAQISGLRDSGCTGGYMTWNATSSLDKYRWIMSAFTPPEEE